MFGQFFDDWWREWYKEWAAKQYEESKKEDFVTYWVKQNAKH